MEGLTGTQDKRKQLSEAERKRRKLEEDMRKEADERRKKRDEMLKRETDIEEVSPGLSCFRKSLHEAHHCLL